MVTVLEKVTIYSRKGNTKKLTQHVEIVYVTKLDPK